MEAYFAHNLNIWLHLNFIFHHDLMIDYTIMAIYIVFILRLDLHSDSRCGPAAIFFSFKSLHSRVGDRLGVFVRKSRGFGAVGMTQGLKYGMATVQFIGSVQSWHVFWPFYDAILLRIPGAFLCQNIQTTLPTTNALSQFSLIRCNDPFRLRHLNDALAN